MPPHKGGHNDQARATVYQEHKSPQSHKTMYGGLTPTQCQKVKEVGDLMTGESATKAQVNGSHNYNCPKVAKFLVE